MVAWLAHFLSSPAPIDLCGRWRFRQAGTRDFLPATVPGCVHTDLLANKRITDPFEYMGFSSSNYKTRFVLKTNTPSENSLYTLVKLADQSE